MIATATTTAVHPRGGAIQPRPEAACAWTRDGLEHLSTAKLAHAPEWCTVIRKAYGHEPLYLTAEDGEGRLGVLPAFVVRRPLFGTIVTSMPFLDSGGPCSASPELAATLVERLIAESRRIKACTVELRCAERLPIAAPPMEIKVNLTLPLCADPAAMWRRLDGSVRNQVRKAQRSGLAVDVCGADALPAFYEIFAARMRDLGSPVHALAFFESVFDSFKTRARIVIVQTGSTPVGALVALASHDRLVVPWAACRKDYFSLCPNMLLYWETIRTGCIEGFRCFDFGRSSRGSGTYRFKRQWGAAEEPLFWYRIRLREPADASHAAAGAGTGLLAPAAAAWRRLPLFVTKRLGPPIRRYLVQ